MEGTKLTFTLHTSQACHHLRDFKLQKKEWEEKQEHLLEVFPNTEGVVQSSVTDSEYEQRRCEESWILPAAAAQGFSLKHLSWTHLRM